MLNVKTTQKLRIYLILAMSLIVAALPLAAGPVLASGQKLFVIKTEHFDIIFPEKSKPSALHLSLVAEDVYAEVSGKLKLELPTRVPVVITPDQDAFNGFTTPTPYMRIVLYDFASDLGWTAFEDNFRSLFLHELTHAVSLQSKAPWISFVSGLFGSWVAPALVNSPMFMVEGVTVSFESADGVGGRANDPLVKQRIRQDIRENRFKSPLEASGLYDEYARGSVYYEYGGLFNAYLQKTYGMDKYADLWKRMGNLLITITLDPYDFGFFRAFRECYGVSFEKVWADFRDSLAIAGVKDCPEILVPPDSSSIASFAAGGKGLYWIDSAASRAYELDLSTGKERALFDSGSGDVISDVSADGRRLLISRLGLWPDGRYRSDTVAYDLGSGRATQEIAEPGLQDARFFREGVVGIESNLHNSDLIYVEKGERRVLLRGSESLMYSSPAVLDEGRIALIVSIKARRTIGILDLGSGSLSLVKPSSEGDAQLLDYVRQISACDGKILFNYDSDDRMYKLGVLSGDSIDLETIDYSGGILAPAAFAGRVYYIGRFSEGEAICRYPAELGAIGETARRGLGYSLEPFAPDERARGRDDLLATAEAKATVLPYRPLDYANPFNCWFFYPDFAALAGGSFGLTGQFMFVDPTEDNSATLGAGYDFGHPFANLGLSWTNSSLPATLKLSLGDSLVYGSSTSPERLSYLSAATEYDHFVFPYPRYLGLGLGGEVFGRAKAGTGSSPYSWSYSGFGSAASAFIGWFGRLPGSAPNSSRGLDLASYHDLAVSTATYKTEGHLAAAMDSPFIKLDLWGAWANASILRLDSTSSVFSSDRRPAYYEYDTLKTGSSSLLAEGGLCWRIANQPIRASLLELYLNRAIVDLGYRGAYFAGEYLQSCFARAGVEMGLPSGSQGSHGRLPLYAFVEGFVRPSVDKPSYLFGYQATILMSTATSSTFGKPAGASARLGGIE